MEASALRAPALARRPLTTPLLRLRSDEQLLSLFRAGSEEAFAALHDRYRQRLFAYVRQMLAASSRADAEDVLQDVFVRAYASLRAGNRDVHVRAWLYRVAHNRCIDQMRRPAPPAADLLLIAGGSPLQDPIETAQRRDDLRRLVADVGRLPAQQRSALLMREIDGLAYADISAALDVTLPAVKSLLVRARMGLVEAIEARETECGVIREDLANSCERGVKASARARRHLRECDGCRDYRTALRGTRRSFAALAPAMGFGPLALVAKALGGGGAALGGGKAAAVVCTAALATGTAVEFERKLGHERQQRAAAASAAPPAAPASAGPVTAAAVAPVEVHLVASGAPPAPARHERADRAVPAAAAIVAPAPPARAPRVTALLTPAATATPDADTSPPAVAPVPEEVEPTVTAVPPVAEAVETATPAATVAPPPAATPPPAPTPALER